MTRSEDTVVHVQVRVFPCVHVHAHVCVSTCTFTGAARSCLHGHPFACLDIDVRSATVKHSKLFLMCVCVGGGSSAILAHSIPAEATASCASKCVVNVGHQSVAILAQAQLARQHL